MGTENRLKMLSESISNITGFVEVSTINWKLNRVGSLFSEARYVFPEM
jgi:hypothetical protein